MPTSQNGYTANNRSKVSTRTIPHTNRRVTVVNGAPGDLLLEWAAWFDKFVEDIEGGVYDDWGYAERPVRGSTTVLSNHASGTALDLNATQHGLGQRGTFTAQQAALIRKELRRYGGCIRWGGDYRNRADEMHFEIDRGRAACALYLAKIRLTTKEIDMSVSPKDQDAIADKVVAKLMAHQVPGQGSTGRATRTVEQTLAGSLTLSYAAVTEGRSQSGAIKTAIDELDR